MTRTPPLALALALAAVGCGFERTPPAPAGGAAETAATALAWQPAVDVARIGTVGDLPPAERTIALTVDADGVLSVDGTATDLAGLTRTLHERGGGGDAGAPVDADVLLVLHAALPWRVGQLVMQECAAASCGRLFFAVRHAADGGPGAFAAFLPRDVGLPREPLRVPKLVARLRPSGTFDVPPAALGQVVARLAAEQGAAPRVEIDAHGDATIADVLTVADAAARGGASFLTFVGTPGRVGDGGLPAEVQAFRTKHRPGVSMEIVGVAVSAQDRADALALDRRPPPRVSGAYAGFATVAADLGLQEEELEELEEPEVDTVVPVEPDER